MWGHLAPKGRARDPGVAEPRRPALYSGRPRWAATREGDRKSVLEQTLRELYGDERAAEALPRVQALIERWREPIAGVLGKPREDPPAGPAFTEREAVLIAYGDHLKNEGEAPLATLGAWCRAHLEGLLSAVHVLPFHPSTSYEGYAISDYTAVDPALGSWADLAEMQQDFDLMMDLVLNHCSASHPWFQ